MLSLKKSFTEHPARPEEAQAQAQAHEEAQAQWEAQAQEEAQEEWWEDPPRGPDGREERGRLTGTLTAFTMIKVLGEFP